MNSLFHRALTQLCCYRMFIFGCSKMTSLTEDVRRSAMLCVLSVPTTMTSHDLMKFVAPFNDVMEHMKIIRDSTPNQYMVLIKFATQVRSCSYQPGLLAVTTIRQKYIRLLLYRSRWIFKCNDLTVITARIAELNSFQHFANKLLADKTNKGFSRCADNKKRKR